MDSTFSSTYCRNLAVLLAALLLVFDISISYIYLSHLVYYYMKLAKTSDWNDSSKKGAFKGIRLEPMQIPIINCNQNHYVFASLSTGFVKSMLFQYPAFVLTRIILFFAFLKTLILDSLKEAKLSNLSAA